MYPIDRRAAENKRISIDQLMATAPKHWVRMYAWLPIVKNRATKAGRCIRYFTLTTGELLDVKMLIREGLLEQTARGYPGLGFCEMMDKTHDEILRKIRWCGWHYKGIFEDMVNGHPSFESGFDFDVINLDFTGVPFPSHEAPLEGTWGSIQKTIDIERTHGTSFDLFLTFRCRKDETDSTAIAQVVKLVDYNLKNGRGVNEFKARVGHQRSQRLLGENYPEFLCLGIPKLLITHALQTGYTLTHFEVCCYPREGGHGRYHIVKFIFSFDIPHTSGHIFAQPPALVSSYDEAVQMIFGKQTLNVDKVLKNDPDLITSLNSDMAQLGNYSIYV